MKENIIIAQSGGPTAVINNSIAGVIQEAKKYEQIKEIYGAINGIEGVLQENIIDLKKENSKTIEGLKKTPSAALGSCRKKLKEEDYERVLKVFKAHNIRYFYYAGGNDSMDTADKVSKLAQQANYDLKVMGIPKTIDNDLTYTDHSPGYGSVARWLAIGTRDAGLDTEAIYTSDTIKIIETMGRDSGWITAATALARQQENDAPHLIYVPEKPFIQEKFLQDVEKVYKKLGYAVISVCEGLKDESGKTIVESKTKIDADNFGHAQRGGVGEHLCNLIKENLKIKARCDKPGTMQRVGMDRTSIVDIKEAYIVGKMAAQHSIKFGTSGYMITLERINNGKYSCIPGRARLEDVANKKKLMHSSFINEEGNDVTQSFIDYAKPLIGGPLPKYAKLKKVHIKKMLP